MGKSEWQEVKVVVYIQRYKGNKLHAAFFKSLNLKYFQIFYSRTAKRKKNGFALFTSF